MTCHMVVQVVVVERHGADVDVGWRIYATRKKIIHPGGSIGRSGGRAVAPEPSIKCGRK